MSDPRHRDARLPFTVLLPDSPTAPIEIQDHSVGLLMTVVEKSAVHRLDETWDSPGVYVLLDQHEDDGSFGVYVGKAPAGVRKRLSSHERNRNWRRALLIQRAGLHPLTSAHAGWLEGDLYALLTAAEDARLHNSMVPGDDTVPSYDLRTLESFRDPITRVLRLLGYDPDSSDDEATMPKPAKRTHTYHGVTVNDLIAAGLVSVGDRLISVNSSWPATAEIGAGGTVLMNDTEYPAPSAAASAVKGGAANGWDFWAVDAAEGSTRLSVIRARYMKAKEAQVP